MMSEVKFTQISIDVPKAIHGVTTGRSGRNPFTRRGVFQDEGYVLKTVLSEAFAKAPKPWRLHAFKEGQATVFCYTDLDLQERLSFAIPELSRAFRVVQVPLPPLQEGMRLRGRVRFAPLVRRKGKEKDAFQARFDWKRDSDVPANREAVYLHYLSQRLRGVRLEKATVQQIQEARVLRPTHKAPGAVSKIVIPQAEIWPELTVTDAEVFTETLRRGIGRHRAYGMGFIHLEPAH